jgi:hypothetical protein
VAHHFGVCWSFLESGNEKLGSFHGEFGLFDLDAREQPCIMDLV